MRILLADDEPFVRDIIARLLHKAGHTVQTSLDGQEAMVAFGEAPYDIVITDLSMPKMDGLALAKGIRARTPFQPIVLLTGSGDDGVLPPNVDCVLAKPVRPEALSAALRRLAVAPLLKLNPSDAVAPQARPSDAVESNQAEPFRNQYRT